MPFDVVVIGAGITGLAAAFESGLRGARAVALEASDRAGGLIRTEHVDGFTIEAGPDSMLAQKPAAIRLCEELGLGPRLISTKPPRTAFVLKGSVLYALPAPSILGIPTTWRGLARYDLLARNERLRVALERVLPRRRGAEQDESVASFFRRRFGPATVPLIAEPLLGGIHAGDIDRLSVRSLFPRLVEAEARTGSVLRAYRRRTGLSSREGLFRSLSSGMGDLVSALVRRLPPDGLVLGSRVTSLVRGDGEWGVETATGTITARAVVLAIPAGAAGALLAPVDAAAARLCAEVPYVSTASMALAFRRGSVRHPLEGSGFVVARRFSSARITACTWVSSKWEGRAPEGHVLLRVFVGGSHDPAAVALTDEELAAVALRDIAPVLGIEDAPLFTRVSRWVDAGAQHNVGQLERMARLEARLASLPGLFVAGSGFRAVGIPDCVADGRAAAAAAAHYAKMAR
ncbi:MAG TPA: protoporphyrinogen oxidase [Vicinamibacterales bacterium]|nr:protoporphyrinogen oxidase [Vicinamibacterales bacterium]